VACALGLSLSLPPPRSRRVSVAREPRCAARVAVAGRAGAQNSLPIPILPLPLSLQRPDAEPGASASSRAGGLEERPWKPVAATYISVPARRGDFFLYRSGERWRGGGCLCDGAAPPWQRREEGAAAGRWSPEEGCRRRPDGCGITLTNRPPAWLRSGPVRCAALRARGWLVGRMGGLASSDAARGGGRVGRAVAPSASPCASLPG